MSDRIQQFLEPTFSGILVKEMPKFCVAPRHSVSIEFQRR